MAKLKDIPILEIGALVLGYLVLKGQGLLGAKKQYDPTNPCPRGQRYSRGLFGDCDAGYVMDAWDKCVCDAGTGTGTGTQQPPATNPPATGQPPAGFDWWSFFGLKPPETGTTTPVTPPITDCTSWWQTINPLSPCFLTPPVTPPPTTPTVDNPPPANTQCPSGMHYGLALDFGIFSCLPNSCASGFTAKVDLSTGLPYACEPNPLPPPVNPAGNTGCPPMSPMEQMLQDNCYAKGGNPYRSASCQVGCSW